MTKTEAREWLRRIREDVRDAEQALRNNDAEAFFLAVQDGGPAFATLEYAIDDRNGDAQGIGTLRFTED